MFGIPDRVVQHSRRSSQRDLAVFLERPQAYGLPSHQLLGRLRITGPVDFDL